MEEKVVNDKQVVKNSRNSAIELLRIISMIMIVFHHFAGHGGFNFTADITFNYVWYLFMLSGGKIGVNIFVLISGYFLIDSKQGFSLKKVLKFWLQLLFYSLVIYFAFCIKGDMLFSIKKLIMMCLPILFNSWWFATHYFILFLLHPVLNLFLNKVSKHFFQAFLIITSIFFSLIPTITTFGSRLGMFAWFFILYCWASYIKLFGLKPKLKCKHYFFLCLILYVLNIVGYLGIETLSSKISLINRYKYRINRIYFASDSFLMLLTSILLFMSFATLKLKTNKFINLVASATFGVYLIHDSNFVRPYLWGNIFKNATYQNSAYLLPYSIIVVCLVFVICSVIELIRKFLIEKYYMKVISKYETKLLVPIKWGYKKIINLFFGNN